MHANKQAEELLIYIFGMKIGGVRWKNEKDKLETGKMKKDLDLKSFIFAANNMSFKGITIARPRPSYTKRRKQIYLTGS